MFKIIDIDRNIGMPHRALPDCLVTAQILVKLLEKASIKDMLEWSNNPSLLKVCSFGKHKNTPWSEIPKIGLLIKIILMKTSAIRLAFIFIKNKVKFKFYSSI